MRQPDHDMVDNWCLKRDKIKGRHPLAPPPRRLHGPGHDAPAAGLRDAHDVAGRDAPDADAAADGLLGAAVRGVLRAAVRGAGHGAGAAVGAAGANAEPDHEGENDGEGMEGRSSEHLSLGS